MQATDLELASRPRATCDAAPCDAAPCGAIAARALCTRVAALRAALEGVEAALPLHDRSLAIVLGARRELEALARDVRALVDWSMPAALHPLACSFEEVGLGAVDALARPDRGRTVVAVEEPRARLHADGTLLSRALARLVEHGLGQGAHDAALHIGPGSAAFTATVSFGGTAQPAATLSAELAGALARRDLSRMGAHLTADDGVLRFVVELDGAEGAR